MVVHLLRRNLADSTLTVTESKEMYDPSIDNVREVDVVIEGEFAGDPITLCLEVIEHKRPAAVDWVEQQIAKHRSLPTNRLTLVSKSGFTRTALKRVAAEGGWVDAATPEVVLEAGKPVIKRLSVGAVQMSPTRCRLLLLEPDPPNVAEVSATPDIAVYDQGGALLGSTMELTIEALNLDWVTRGILLMAHDHPERDDLKSFVLGLQVLQLGYHVRDETTGQARALVHLQLEGEFRYMEIPLDLTLTDLSGRRFVTGETSILDRATVWVGTTDEGSHETKLSWRTKDGEALVPQPAVPKPRRPAVPSACGDARAGASGGS